MNSQFFSSLKPGAWQREAGGGGWGVGPTDRPHQARCDLLASQGVGPAHLPHSPLPGAVRHQQAQGPVEQYHWSKYK